MRKIKLSIYNILESIKFPLYNKYSSCIDYNEDKFIYLLSKKISMKYIIYPDFINVEKDSTIKNNKKRKFKYSCNNYTLKD
jgi:hypothetical protein